MSACLRIREIKSPTWASTTSILHLLISSSQEKDKLRKNTKVLQGTKGMQTQEQVPAKMDYSSLALNFSCLQCIQRVPYIALQWGNERSNPSDLKAYGRPGDK